MSFSGISPMSPPSKIGCSALAVGAVLAGGIAPANAPPLSELALPWPWGLPFIGLLLSIAVGPPVAPKVLHAHYGKIAFLWGALPPTPPAALPPLPPALATLPPPLLA